MREKDFLIGILSFLSAKLLFNFCSVLMGCVFNYPSDEVSSIFVLVPFAIVGLIVFRLLCRVSFSIRNVVLLSILPIAIGLGNWFLVNYFSAAIDIKNYLLYYSLWVVVDKIFVVSIVVFLLVRVLVRTNRKRSDILDQPIE